MIDDYKNIAGTKEYLEYRKTCDWLFELEPGNVETKQLSELFSLQIYAYENEKESLQTGYLTHYSAVKALLKSSTGDLLKEIKSIDGHFFAQLVKHSNGREYLIYNTDLYGYSVMDMSAFEFADYIPYHSFAGGETFIWCEKHYCPANDLLVVDGCYWACPWGLAFYDFSDPMQLPLPKFCDSYQLSEKIGMSIDDDISFAGFTSDGDCVIDYLDLQGQSARKIVSLSQLR